MDPSPEPYAGKIAEVETVDFYHGADELYTLSGVPGVWHEACMKAFDK
jgi:hypothetical protein